MSSPPPAFDILGIGTIAVDDCLQVDAYPPADGKAPVRGRTRTCGGQVATALAAACRLGARCAYAAVLDSGDLSRFALDSLQQAGVDTRFVRRAPGAAPIHSVIISEARAKTRAIFFDTCRVVPVEPSGVSAEMVGSAKVLLIDQLGPHGSIHAARLAAALDIPIVADLEWPREPGAAEIIALAGHLILPLDFSRAYTGLDDPRGIVSRLHAGGVRPLTAVTCGRDGSFFASGNDAAPISHIPALPVETVETTGCGDVFHGAYAFALAGSSSPAGALRYAAAVAGLYAARPTGWEHLPSRVDVEDLLWTAGSPPFSGL